MTTVIKNGGESESSSVGMILGVLLAIVLVVLFFVYALPALRGGTAAPGNNLDVNVDLPSPGGASGGLPGDAQ